MVYFNQWRGRKFPNIKTVFEGKQYDSKFEADVAAELEMRKRGKDIKSWERQITIHLTAHNRPICTYRIDFVVTHKDGTKEYIEAKGYATDTWKLKWKLFEAQMAEEEPNSILTVINQSNSWKNYKPKKRL